MARELVAGDLAGGEGSLRYFPESIEDAEDLMAAYGVPSDYWALYEVTDISGDVTEGELPDDVGMTRDWGELSASTRERYSSSRRLERLARDVYGRTGSREEVVRRWYEHGGDMRAARGHHDPEDYAEFRMQIEEAEAYEDVERTVSYELWIAPGGHSARHRGRGRPH